MDERSNEGALLEEGPRIGVSRATRNACAS